MKTTPTNIRRLAILIFAMAATAFAPMLAPLAPALRADTFTGTVGAPFDALIDSGSITAGHAHCYYGLTGGTLPPGLDLVDTDNSACRLTGTPAQTGAYPCEFYVQYFTSTLDLHQTTLSHTCLILAGTTTGTGSGTTSGTGGTGGLVPDITANSPATGTVGAPFSHQVTANHQAVFIATDYQQAAALGLVFTTATNIAGAETVAATLSGTPALSGSWTLPLYAVNATGTGAATLALAFVNGTTSGTGTPPDSTPIITSASFATGTVGQPFDYAITSVNPTGTSAPHAYAVTGTLPAGLAFDTLTGHISGTPAPAAFGGHRLTLAATNPAGTGTAPLDLMINGLPPVIVTGTPAALTGTAGQPFAHQILANGVPAPDTYAAQNLPAGLVLSTTTGHITGTPSASGTYAATLAATNLYGTATAAQLFLIATATGTDGGTTSGTGGTGGGSGTGGLPGGLLAITTATHLPALTLATSDTLLFTAGALAAATETALATGTAHALLATDTLAIPGTGAGPVIMIDTGAATGTAAAQNPFQAIPLLQQDETHTLRLLAADTLAPGTPAGGAAALLIGDPHGHAHGPGAAPAPLPRRQNAAPAAHATYDFAPVAFLAGPALEVILAHTLVTLDLPAGQTATLAGAGDFHAPITGAGNLAIAATATGAITLARANPAFTGTVTLVSGTLRAAAANALGAASLNIALAAQPFSPGAVKDDPDYKNYHSQPFFFGLEGYLKITKPGAHTLAVDVENTGQTYAFVGKYSIYVEGNCLARSESKALTGNDHTLSVSADATLEPGMYRVRIPFDMLYDKYKTYQGDALRNNYSNIKITFRLKEPGARRARVLTEEDLYHKE
jgi:hypothetical protein